MNIKKHIPNSITLLNLFCGCIALVFVSKLDFQNAFLFVCLGIFLDFFDGFFARLFKVSSPLGLQLDSLADMVTSGVVPGYVMYQMFSNEYAFGQNSIFSYLGFVITLGACYRLANFNIDTRQTDSFIGLPTPANALFFLSIPLWLTPDSINYLPAILFSKWFYVALCFLSAFIMNAEIPLFSLKIKYFSLKKNALQIFFLISCLFFILFFRNLGVAMIIVFYVLLSVINNSFIKKK
ncbi:CDP-alcohol phosphatidyltransferase family protein [Flavobacterium sp.]|uniref:CDP-alcohol phosphatidyltransferase family protein n=1 Tax=Flavobacterium sp. TaxID=239 RepID=UPI00286E2BF5|nr:CDP-alcohol phosphatidyltransferase family protein [Flavobacterium sp.]